VVSYRELGDLLADLDDDTGKLMSGNVGIILLAGKAIEVASGIVLG
jgi:hypothetical protein